MIAEGRRRFEPPTVEEIEAYIAGELSEEDAERVRERLTYYPELARVLTAEEPEEEQVLSEFERAQDWKAIQRKIHPQRRRIAAIAAAAAVAGIVLVTVILYRSPSPAPPSRPLVATYQLRPDGIAGTAQRPLQIERCDRCTFRVLYAYAGEYPSYHIDVLDLSTTPPRLVLTRPNVRRDPANGAYVIEVAGLAAGFYRLELHGVREKLAERRAVYTVEVVGR